MTSFLCHLMNNTKIIIRDDLIIESFNLPNLGIKNPARV